MADQDSQLEGANSALSPTPPPSFPPSASLPLEVGPLNTATGVWGAL